VFGDLVPYGANWRTGANSNTKIKFSEDVIIGGKSVPAGEYSMYSVPSEGDWTIILNSSTGNWGTTGYDKSKDVVRFKAPSYYLTNKVETYSMQFTNISYDQCDLEMIWEYTKVVIPIEADNQETIAKNIKKALNGKKDAPYFQVANYYNERNENLDKAYEYVNRAIKDNPKAYYMYYLKARIAQKLDMVEEAIAAAEKSIEVAKGTPSEAEYKRLNTRIIRALD
jgi:tetratricopeptide (TPR) repeat protein